MYTSNGAPLHHSPILRCSEIGPSTTFFATIQTCQNYVLVIMKKPKPAGEQTIEHVELSARCGDNCPPTLTVGLGNTFDFVFLLDAIHRPGDLKFNNKSLSKAYTRPFMNLIHPREKARVVSCKWRQDAPL